MGGFNPISAVLSAATSVLKPAYNAYDAGDQYRYARAVYDVQEKQIQQSAEQQRKQLALDAEKESTDRRNALKRTMAKQQVLFGGQGIDTTDGSGEAVLLGLLKENDEEKSYRERLDQLKRASLAQDTDTKRKRNLLSLQNSYSSARNSAADTLFGVL